MLSLKLREVKEESCTKSQLMKNCGGLSRDESAVLRAAGGMLDERSRGNASRVNPSSLDSTSESSYAEA